MLLREKERSRSVPARIAELTIMAVALAFVCVTLFGAGPTWAQSFDENVYRVNYWTNRPGVADSGGTLRITNPGEPPKDAAIIPPIPDPVCASIYIFRPDEQLAECCSCWVSANALREFNVSADLLSNPLTVNPLVRGAIKIVSSLGTTGMPPTSDSQCDPRWPFLNPFRSVKAWITHLNQFAGNPATFSESEFSKADLSDGEKGTLEQECWNVWFQGSGRGRCSCPPPPGP